MNRNESKTTEATEKNNDVVRVLIYPSTELVSVNVAKRDLLSIYLSNSFIS